MSKSKKYFKTFSHMMHTFANYQPWGNPKMSLGKPMALMYSAVNFY